MENIGDFGDFAPTFTRSKVALFFFDFGFTKVTDERLHGTTDGETISETLTRFLQISFLEPMLHFIDQLRVSTQPSTDVQFFNKCVFSHLFLTRSKLKKDKRNDIYSTNYRHFLNYLNCSFPMVHTVVVFASHRPVGILRSSTFLCDTFSNRNSCNFYYY